MQPGIVMLHNAVKERVENFSEQRKNIFQEKKCMFQDDYIP